MAALDSPLVAAMRLEHLQVEAALKAEFAASQKDTRGKHLEDMRCLAQEHEQNVACDQA